MEPFSVLILLGGHTGHCTQGNAFGHVWGNIVGYCGLKLSLLCTKQVLCFCTICRAPRGTQADGLIGAEDSHW